MKIIQISTELILKAVSVVYNISIADMLGRSRRAAVAEARMMAMYMIQRHTRMTLMEIGHVFGRKHSTVIHAIRRINELAQIDKHVCRRAQCIFIQIEYLYTHPEHATCHT